MIVLDRWYVLLTLCGLVSKVQNILLTAVESPQADVLFKNLVFIVE